MKNATLFIFLLFSGVLYAQFDVDLAGNFSYEYVSTNTDGTVKYNIKFHYACDTAWTGMTTTTFGSYKKNSTPTPYPTLSMSTVQSGLMNSSPCGDHVFNKFTWQQTLDLDPYSQYEFVHNWCCRAPYIANIDTNGGIPNQYARMIMLTGRQGVRPNNSSPDYSNVYFSAPINTETPLEICSADPDGDSLSFVIINSKRGSIHPVQGFTMNNISYDTISGYNSAQPLGPGGSVFIDPSSRMLMVKSDSSQFNLLTVRVIEWAKDTTNTYKIMGVNNKEMFIDFTGGYAPSLYGINANYASSTLNSDSIYVNLKKDVNLTSRSLDSNIVTLVSPSADTASISAMKYAGSKSELFLRTDSLDAPGVWKIYFTKHGNFANRGKCGEPLVDTVLVNIPIPGIQLIGDTGYVYVGPSREYFVLNGQYYDSISWICTNGNLTGGHHDTVQVNWGSSSNGPGFLLAEAVKLKNGSNFILSLSRDSLTVDVNGLSLEERTSKILIYPNPTAYEIGVVGVASGTDYEITNFDGKTVMRSRLEGSKINVSELPTGPYFLRFRNNGTWLSKELMITR